MLSRATFGGGCFWCTEAIFKSVKGVQDVKPGYAGGDTVNPNYNEICSGDTGHAEVIQLNFDPKIITYEDLLLIFFKTHDPTLLNQQGNDVGTQYRSVIYYHDEPQRVAAQRMMDMLKEQQIYSRPLVTELSPFEVFYDAEDYHRNYYFDNPAKPYCSFVIQPKLAKFAAEFGDKIKSELR